MAAERSRRRGRVRRLPHHARRAGEVRAALDVLAEPRVVIFNGGTGIAPRDTT